MEPLCRYRGVVRRPDGLWCAMAEAAEPLSLSEPFVPPVREIRDLQGTAPAHPTSATYMRGFESGEGHIDPQLSCSEGGGQDAWEDLWRL